MSIMPLTLFRSAAAGVRLPALLATFGLCTGSALCLHAQSPIFTEDFESGRLDPAVWDVRTSGDVQVTVQSAQVAHGKAALQIHYPKGSARNYGFIVAAHLPEAVRAHFFGRASVYISPGMPAGHDVLLNAGSPGYPLSNFLEVGVSGGKNVMTSYQQNAANVPRGETLARGIAYPVGRWFCLEWEFTDHPDHTLIWIDGQKAGELVDFTFKPRAPRPARTTDGTAPEAPAAPAPAAVPGTDLVKGFYDFAFGFRAWGGAAKDDFDIYYDDLAIDTKRIGPVN